MVIDEEGEISSARDYYAYGAILQEVTIGEEEKYKFTEKERDSETGLDYFGARYYDSDIGRWMSVDPLADMYPGLSPYNYTLNNPFRFIDPDGMSVYTGSNDDRETILNTLSEEERKYIQFDDNGLLNTELMNEYADGGGNFNALSALANSKDIFKVMVTNKLSISGKVYEFGNATVDTDFDGGYSSLSTSETGWTGQTITKNESNNGNVQIAINQSLSKAGRAETFAHEGYGHAYFMATGKNPDHIYLKSNQPFSFREGNTALKNQIIKSILETRKNMGN